VEEHGGMITHTSTLICILLMQFISGEASSDDAYETPLAHHTVHITNPSEHMDHQAMSVLGGTFNENRS
jgi:hypothetical protein